MPQTIKGMYHVYVNTKSLRITGLDTDSIAKFWDVTKTPTTDVRGSTVL